MDGDRTEGGPITPFDVFRAYVRRHLRGPDGRGYLTTDERIWTALESAAELTARDCPDTGFFDPIPPEETGPGSPTPGA